MQCTSIPSHPKLHKQKMSVPLIFHKPLTDHICNLKKNINTDHMMSLYASEHLKDFIRNYYSESGQLASSKTLFRILTPEVAGSSVFNCIKYPYLPSNGGLIHEHQRF